MPYRIPGDRRVPGFLLCLVDRNLVGGVLERVSVVEYLIQRVKSKNKISRRTDAKIPSDYYSIYTENKSSSSSGVYASTRVDTSAYDGVYDQQEILARAPAAVS